MPVISTLSALADEAVWIASETASVGHYGRAVDQEQRSVRWPEAGAAPATVLMIHPESAGRQKTAR